MLSRLMLMKTSKPPSRYTMWEVRAIILSGLIWMLMVNHLRWNWTQIGLCRSPCLTSISRNLTGFPCTTLDCPLKPALGKTLSVEVLKVPLDCQTQREVLDLYVVKNKGPALLGRDWLCKIRLDWCSIKFLQASLTTSKPKKRLDVMLDKYANVFQNELSTSTSAKASVTLKYDSQARFLKARLMPYALKQKMEEELRRLQNEGILTKGEWSEWAHRLTFPVFLRKSCRHKNSQNGRQRRRSCVLADWPLPKRSFAATFWYLLLC